MARSGVISCLMSATLVSESQWNWSCWTLPRCRRNLSPTNIQQSLCVSHRQRTAPLAVSALRSQMIIVKMILRPPTCCTCNWFDPGRRAPTFCVSGGVASVLPGRGIGQEAFLDKQEWNLQRGSSGPRGNLQRWCVTDELRE